VLELLAATSQVSAGGACLTYIVVNDNILQATPKKRR
jgi:hypothetical protein